MAGVHGRDVHAALFHEAAAERDALRRIVVAAEQEHLREGGEAHEKIVEERDGLRGRGGLVVEIAAQQRGVRRFLARDPQDFAQNIGLILEQRTLVEPLAEVQVREMQQLHSPFSSFFAVRAARRSAFHASSDSSRCFARCSLPASVGR